MDKDLRAKIIELFEYRRLPQLMAHTTGVLDEIFYNQLIDLQASIYHLDHELETHWAVAERLIAERWTAIHNDLKTIGVPTAQLDNYCKHIYKYQKHELDLREHKLPLRLSMEYFYFYKSCDVKLLRKLIYDRYPSLHQLASLSSWRLFDLVTEVDDDVEDLYEDMTTINGNRFLLSLLKEGGAATESTYRGFLAVLEGRLAAQKQASNLGHENWTLKAITDTTALLDERLAKLDRSQIATARIAGYLADVSV